MGKSILNVRSVRWAVALIILLFVAITATQPVASVEEVSVELWVITVRGTAAEISLICDDETAVSWPLDPTRRGWNFYAFSDTLPADCELLTLEIDSVFPANSLGWKFKGIELHLNGGGNLVTNGCFTDGLNAWDNVQGAYSHSVDATKNVIPGVCDGTGNAAKHGPVTFTGLGTPGVWAQLQQTIALPPAAPTPTPAGTAVPTPTPTPTPEPLYLPVALGQAVIIDCPGEFVLTGQNQGECR